MTVAGEAAGSALDNTRRELARDAAFLFTRETTSLANLQKEGLAGPRRMFVPDGTFSFDIKDEPRAEAFLKANDLAGKPFIAVIPRLRYTPYHRFRKTERTEAENARRDAVNDKHAETDHAKLREAIVAWVRKTGGRVLLCPEMTYEIDLIDPLLYDPLPSEIKSSVVRRKTFWLPDEAASVYARARAVVSCECHSPILAATRGTPCLYVHQPEDGVKGQMWADLGLADWRLKIEETTGAQLAAKLLEIEGGHGQAVARVRAAVDKAQDLHRDGAGVIRQALKG